MRQFTALTEDLVSFPFRAKDNWDAIRVARIMLVAGEFGNVDAVAIFIGDSHREDIAVVRL